MTYIQLEKLLNIDGFERTYIDISWCFASSKSNNIVKLRTLHVFGYFELLEIDFVAQNEILRN